MIGLGLLFYPESLRRTLHAIPCSRTTIRLPRLVPKPACTQSRALLNSHRPGSCYDALAIGSFTTPIPALKLELELEIELGISNGEEISVMDNGGGA